MPRFFRSNSSKENQSPPSKPLPSPINFLRGRESSSSGHRRTRSSPDDSALNKTSGLSPGLFLRRQSSSALSGIGRHRRNRSMDKAARKSEVDIKEEVFRVSVLQVRGKQETEQKPIDAGILRIRSAENVREEKETISKPRSFFRRGPSQRGGVPSPAPSGENNAPSALVSRLTLNRKKTRSFGSVSSSDSTIKQSARHSYGRQKDPVGHYQPGQRPDVEGLRFRSQRSRSTDLKVRSNLASVNERKYTYDEEEEEDLPLTSTPPRQKRQQHSESVRQARSASAQFPELVGEPAFTPPRSVPSAEKKMRFRSDAIANKVNKQHSTMQKRQTPAYRQRKKPQREKSCADDPTVKDISETCGFGIINLCPFIKSMTDIDDEDDDDEEEETMYFDDDDEEDIFSNDHLENSRGHSHDMLSNDTDTLDMFSKERDGILSNDGEETLSLDRDSDSEEETLEQNLIEGCGAY